MSHDYSELEKSLIGSLGEGDVSLVRRAFEVAAAAHSGQTRDEGSPYIVHPLRVAISLVEELGVTSPVMICAALLHDVIEDTDITRNQIADMFGEEVATIVWLLTKFEETTLREYLAAIEAAAETGAPLVKLCDRLDNLRSLPQSPRLEKKRRYIHVTREHFLPLAARTDKYLYDEIQRSLQKVIDQVESIDG